MGVSFNCSRPVSSALKNRNRIPTAHTFRRILNYKKHQAKLLGGVRWLIRYLILLRIILQGL